MTTPRHMTKAPLPTPPGPDAAVLAMVDAMLDQTIDPAAIAGSVDPAVVAERVRRAQELRELDWPALSRYRAANASIERPDLVMMGDSITEIWGRAAPDLFGARIVNRGISGQTSGQMLLRFYADVVELKPARAHLLCGTNDIAGNSGPNTPEDYQRNILAMADIAGANGIALILGSITPALGMFWAPEAEATVWVPYLNAWLRNLADRRGLCFIDYHALLAGPDGGLQPLYSADGVHVSRAAYHAMTTLLEQTLATL